MLLLTQAAIFSLTTLISICLMSEFSVPSDDTLQAEINSGSRKRRVSDLYEFGSQDTTPSDLDDGPPTKRVAGPTLVERVHAVLDSLKEHKFNSLIEFLHLLFYGDKTLREDQACKTARTQTTSSHLFRQLLFNILGPPRTKAKGATATKGHKVLERFAFDVVTPILEQELLDYGVKVLYHNTLCSVSENSDQQSLMEELRKELQIHSPNLLKLLSIISRPPGKSEENRVSIRLILECIYASHFNLR